MVPQTTDGPRIDPPVSDPIANATPPAAVALAGPADDPPDPSLGFPDCSRSKVSRSDRANQRARLLARRIAGFPFIAFLVQDGAREL
jgi:hypothetical protein